MKSCWIFSVWVAGCVVPLATICGGTTNNRTPLQIEQTVESNYPPSVLAEGVSSGEVWLMITVDEAGSLTDAMVTRYTHTGFTSEALRAVRSLKFKPAQADGVPVPVRTELHLFFESSGSVVTLDPQSAITQLTGFAYANSQVKHLCAPGELDRMPAATETVSPIHPGHFAHDKALGGKAMLDFIIDENGKPRMPVVVSSTDDQFAIAAADALNQWRFTPPVRQGKPVAVQVRQEFVFATTSNSDDAGGVPAKRFSASMQEHDRPTL